MNELHDRDSIYELFSIVTNACHEIHLPLTASGLQYVKLHLGTGFDYDCFYRRRLSVCRTLIDLYLPVNRKKLDIMLAATLLNHMPVDTIPEDHDEILGGLFSVEPAVTRVLSVLRHRDYMDKSYYDRLISNPYALIIRLAERAVLVEKLYEWDPTDALRFIRETRESFYPMCLYAKEHYPDFFAAANILHEKMRNLTTVNEALLSRFVETENAISDEILALREENTAIRAMIRELQA